VRRLLWWGYVFWVMIFLATLWDLLFRTNRYGPQPLDVAIAFLLLMYLLSGVLGS
jgi:hypothetical protein